MVKKKDQGDTCNGVAKTPLRCTCNTTKKQKRRKQMEKKEWQGLSGGVKRRL